MRDKKVGSDADGQAVIVQCFLIFTQISVYVGAGNVRIGVVRPQFDGCRQVVQGVFPVTLAQEHHGPIEVYCRVLKVFLYGCIVVGQRFVQTPHFRKQDGSVVIGIRVDLIEGNGSVEITDGFLCTIEENIEVAPVVVGPGIGRIQFNDFGVIGQRFFVAAFLGIQHGAVEVGVGVVWAGGDYFVEFFYVWHEGGFVGSWVRGFRKPTPEPSNPRTLMGYFFPTNNIYSQTPK